MYDKWLQHIKAPKELMNRVKKYNEHLFSRYKGLDENKILADLPMSTRNEILEFILTDLFEAVEIFPNDEMGLFANMINDFELFILTEGEYVFRVGETSEEIFFIVDGEIAITTGENKELVRLKKNDFFGEMSVLDDSTTVRSKNAIARTNVTLAIWHLPHIKEVWKKFPTVKEKMLGIARARKMKNEGKDADGKELEPVLLLQGLEANPKSQEDVKSPSAKSSPDSKKGHKEFELSQDENMLNGSKHPLHSPSKGDILFSPLESSSFKYEGADPLRSTKLNDKLNDYKSKEATLISPDETAPLNMKRPEKLSITNESGAVLLHKQEDGVSNQSEETGQKVEQSKEHEVKAGDAEHKDMNHHYVATKGNQSFCLSQNMDFTRWQASHKTHLPSKLAYLEKGFVKFETGFKEVRPLMLNLILLFDVIFAPLNIAFEIATSGPLTYLEMTFAFILFLNLLFDLKDYFKQKKEFKRVFPSALVLAALGIGPPKDEHQHHSQDMKRAVSYHGRNRQDHSRRSQINNTTHNDGHGGHGGHGSHGAHGHGGHGDHGHAHAHDVTLFVLFLDVIFMIPFTVLFHAFHVHGASENGFLIALQLLKIFAVEHLTWIFQREFFKKRYALNNILVILYAFLIFNHIVACIFVIMANAKHDFNETWYAKIPAPQFDYPYNHRSEFDADHFTIYIHATYWAYMTTSHVGMGDVTAVNSDEKIYSAVIIMLSTFIYAFLFGNLASLVDDLTPKFQKEYETSYRVVLEYVKNSKLDLFLDKIHKYYNYIWQDNKGIDENQLLGILPNSLRYDIFMSRYENVINNSKFFKDDKGKFDSRIYSTFCKKYKCGVFMENDAIVSAGQEINDIFIILEGEAEVVSYNLMEKGISFFPGDFLGGIIPNVMQIQSIKASQITKVAIFPQEAFSQLVEAFPQWYEEIMKTEPLYTKLHKYAKVVKQRLADKKNGIVKKPSNIGEASPRINVKHAPSMQDEVRELDEDEWVSQDFTSKKSSEKSLGVPVRKDEDKEIRMPNARASSQSKKRQNLLPPKEKTDFETPGKSTELNSSPTKDPLMYLSPRLPGSPRNNNGLPPGDKEPLEDQFVIPPIKDAAWMDVVDPSPESSKGEGEREGDPLAQIVANQKSPITAAPLMSPAVNDNNKYTPRRASVFKRDLDAVKPDGPTVNKLSEEDEKKFKRMSG